MEVGAWKVAVNAKIYSEYFRQPKCIAGSGESIKACGALVTKLLGSCDGYQVQYCKEHQKWNPDKQINRDSCERNTTNDMTKNRAQLRLPLFY